jgi:hypothetical protein
VTGHTDGIDPDVPPGGIGCFEPAFFDYRTGDMLNGPRLAAPDDWRSHIP